MKIAIVASIDKQVQPDAKGGTEVWTANFILEHAKKNIDVDLYAVGGSIQQTHINLIETLPKALPEFYKEEYFSKNPQDFVRRKEQLMATVYSQTLMRIKENESAYDCIIDSCSYPAFTFNTKYFTKPVLIIGHFPIDFAIKFYTDRFGLPENNYFVLLSQFQMRQADFIPVRQKRLIPSGIPIEKIPFYVNGGAYMVWISRVHERINKGLEEAMHISNKLQLPFQASAYIETSSEEYFSRNILPLRSNYASVNRRTLEEHFDKYALFGNAKLFLYPLQWEEPFGLVLVESMATGTPIVAFARGSLPDVVEDGVTGFLVNPSADDIRGNFIIKKTGTEGIEEAVHKIYDMPDVEYKKMRENCRKHVKEKFVLSRMVDDYVRLYKDLFTSAF